MNRRKLSGKASRRNFRSGTGTHKKNLVKKPQRGGIRL